MVFDEYFDVVVIGAGHAGCEAASAAARLGASTALVTLNLDLIGQMSCNPAVGGIAKGHLVREIDALGGIMGRVIDRTGIQFRLLNRSRGPAVQSPRAQADRALYRTEMRRTLERTPNLSLRQGMVADFIVENNRVTGVELVDTRRIGCASVVVATGTFLNGLIHTGKRTYTAGRAGEPASVELAESLKRRGFPVGRLKTGTPPRLDGRTIDWDAFVAQPADEKPVPFSFATDVIQQPQITCYVGYTNDSVHDAIRLNLDESPLYSGKIKGVGPRYCPSIEDKVVKFAEKDRHQLFLEPEGHDTNEVYLNGFSTSLPSDLQQQLVRMIPGLDRAEIIRPGYAIEYDFIDPRQLTPFLESRQMQGLFTAGQINGTTGYEEAACQGFMAGINAAQSALKQEGFRLRRDEAYIGVLIDDLITHGVDEPYRIFTSRAENRLMLRHDNADGRLSHYGRELGLVNDWSWDRFNDRQERIADLRKVLLETKIKRADPAYNALAQTVSGDLGDAITLAQLALRPGVDAGLVAKFLPEGTIDEANERDLDSALADLLYRGYIGAQQAVQDRLYQHDTLPLPDAFDFRTVSGLSNEMVERLERTRPLTFGQARKIPGMTSSALSILLVQLSSDRNRSASA
ncbi:MAG: tRNA uridine-5-carboxymethylaminomethyl(34) synthesis enzyme MnmG [Pyrinomonadaceae bacterium]